MAEMPDVQRVGDHVFITQDGQEIVVYVDHIVDFVKTVFTATTGHVFKEDKEK